MPLRTQTRGLNCLSVGYKFQGSNLSEQLFVSWIETWAKSDRKYATVPSCDSKYQHAIGYLICLSSRAQAMLIDRLMLSQYLAFKNERSMDQQSKQTRLTLAK